MTSHGRVLIGHTEQLYRAGSGLPRLECLRHRLRFSILRRPSPIVAFGGPLRAMRAIRTSSAQPHVTPLAGFIGQLARPGSSKPTAPNIHTYNTMWSSAEHTSLLPQRDGGPPPSYSEVSNDPSPTFPGPAAKKAAEPSPQRYASLLPPAGPSALLRGPPPSYESVTPGQRRITPPAEPPEIPWLKRLLVSHASASIKPPPPPPRPEGVLLELVVDRFGNRKREIRPMRSMRERMQDRARNGTTFQLSTYYLSKML